MKASHDASIILFICIVLTISIALYCHFYPQQSKILDKSIINEIISSEEELFEDIDASAELSICGSRRLL